MSTCPPEWAAQVDAVHDRPFSAKDAPLGSWYKNNQGNVCLTLPDTSYYYFNVKRDWYFLQREPNKPDRDCKSIYLSPPGDRFYNPSSDTRQVGSSYIGVYWKSLSEKVCNTDPEGNISFTFRKLFDATDLPNLPRKYIAVFTSREGSQRVVEVDEGGVYNGNTQWVIDEIDYWLANLVPVDNIDGPEWRRAHARQLTPPAERERVGGIPSNGENARGSGSRAATPSVKKEEEIETQTMEQEPVGTVSSSDSSRASTPSIKREGLEPDVEQDDAGTLSSSEEDRSFDGMSDSSRASTPHIKKEESEEMGESMVYGSEAEEMDDEEMKEEETEDQQMKEEDSPELKEIMASTGSGRACMRKLLDARKPKSNQVVQGARISKKTAAPKPVRGLATRD